MATNNTTKTPPPAAGDGATAADALVTVRVKRHGVHADGCIFGKGAVVRMKKAEADGLVANGSAVILS